MPLPAPPPHLPACLPAPTPHTPACLQAVVLLLYKLLNETSRRPEDLAQLLHHRAFPRLCMLLNR